MTNKVSRNLNRSNQPTRSARRSLAVFVCGLIISSIATSTASAQDIVFVRNSKGTETRQKGEIVQWQGQVLKLQIGSREKSIKNRDIIRVETDWSEDYVAARQHLQGRDFGQAVQRLSRFNQAEQRPWASSIMRADLIRCLDLLENFEAAGEAFIFTAQTNDSRFTSLAPLPWDRVLREGNVTRLAEGWLARDSEPAQLLGASWLLGTRNKENAVAALQQLADSRNPEIAHLASLQLWRIRIVTADQNDLQRLEAQIERMPRSVRAGGHFIAGEICNRLGQTDNAILHYMRLPILYPDNYRLAGVGLQKSAGLMQNPEQINEATRLLRELVNEYGGSRFAAEADSILKSMEQNQ